MATSATGISLLECVEKIAPVIRENAAAGERERRLSQATVQAMQEAGLYRMCKPRAFGGMEVDAMTAMRVCEEVSRLDTAAGWNLQISSAGFSFLAWTPEACEEVLASDSGPILAGAVSPPGKAIPVDGGYRVTGRWPFASGCDHASWLIGSAFIYDGDEPRRGENGNPIMLLLIFPAGAAAIFDTWHTMGLRGTGSHDIALDNVFIPQRRAVAFAPLESFPAAMTGPLYRMTLWFPIAAVATPALGTARAAIDALLDLAGRKTPAYTRSTLAQRPVVQRQMGQAEALLGAARAYLYESVTDAWMTASQGRALSQRQKINLQLAASHAIRSGADVAALVHEAAGSTGIRQEQPFERYFRDTHTMTQHAFASASRFESVGKLLLGQESDWAGFFAM